MNPSLVEALERLRAKNVLSQAQALPLAALAVLLVGTRRLRQAR